MAIVKKAKFMDSYSCDMGGCERKDSYGWMIIDPVSMTVGYRRSECSCAPYALNVIQALLADKDVRKMIKAYALTERKERYYIDHSTGMSGRSDYYINFCECLGDSLHVTKRKHLLHVSGAGKLTEGLRDLYIGDLVELIAYLQANSGKIWTSMPRGKLRSLSKIKYVKERTIPTDKYHRIQATVTDLFGGADNE